MLEDLNNCYEAFEELRKDTEHISVPKKPWRKENPNISEKIIAFLYSNMISFCRTVKVKGVPLSKKFISNINHIMENTHCIHHSHISGEILGYAHTFCNKKTIYLDLISFFYSKA